MPLHSGTGPASFSDPARLAEEIVKTVGKTIGLALPMGVGKANHIANALYDKAAADPSLRLRIFTGLTLEAPRGKSDLERRFLGPLVQRVFAGYPELRYAGAVRAGKVPANIEINEFFFEAGQWLSSPYAQRHYICANYTHALQFVLDRGVNVVAQLVARCAKETQHPYSLSCNPDLTLDLLKLRRGNRADFVFAGQVNSELPFMSGDAAIGADDFDFVLEGANSEFPLFAPPREPILLTHYAAGAHAASTVPDGGTLQIGIGSAGDAVAQCLILRQNRNEDFRKLLSSLDRDLTPNQAVHAERFIAGLYGCTEMFVEGMLDLFNAGILKREIDGVVLHGGFFIGSRAFYRTLREMPRETLAKFGMTSISYTNELYHDEDAKRRARKDARFINDAMMATLLGDVISDGLEDGRIVSGVGGQYDFVAQGFALEGARSVLVLPATRMTNGKIQSNIRWRYGHTTIPRHLRDMIVTEYGIADIRGKTDGEVIAAMLAITDSRYQDDLLRQAKGAGKIEPSFAIPGSARDNTPERIERVLKPFAEAGLLPQFPFGTDFTAVEQRLIPALDLLKSSSPAQLAKLFWRGWSNRAVSMDCLERLGLSEPKRLVDRFYANLVRGALSSIRAGA